MPFIHVLCRHIRSHSLIVLLALVAFVVVHPACALSFEIIVVKNADLRPYQDALRGLKDACTCDVQEVSSGNGDVAELVLRKSPDAVVAIGTGAFRRVRYIAGLPVIYAMVIPSEAALSLPQNISGVSMDISPETYINAMTEMFPEANRVGLLYDPKNTSEFVAAAAKAAAAAGIELHAKQARDSSEVAALLDKMRGKIDIFWMLPDPTVVTSETIDYLLRLSFEHNLPVFSFSNKYVEMGAVAALDVDPYDIGTQLGELVRELSTGNSRAVRAYARKAQLTINAKVAKKMGLKIKEDVLQRADKVE